MIACFCQNSHPQGYPQYLFCLSRAKLTVYYVLQGEHGTGRNVAPYVEMEWGTTAYELMWQLKELFDPEYVLNPGVILNAVRHPLPGTCISWFLRHLVMHARQWAAPEWQKFAI